MIFNKYAQYYNLLYKDKNYKKEVDYIDSLIKKYSLKKSKTLLDIGCGTGNHDILFSEKDYKVTGIDASDDMISIANKKINKNLKFYKADGTNFNFNMKFDVILSLFHVINYYNNTTKLLNAIQSVKNHLKIGGLFIFDTWYGPAVLNEKPSIRIKEIEDNEIKVKRTAIPNLYINENIVDINYDIIIEYKNENKRENIKELHKIRYLFKTEIDILFSIYNFELIKFEEWLTGNEPNNNTWGVCFIGRKK